VPVRKSGIRLVALPPHRDRASLLAGASALALILAAAQADARPLGGPAPTPSAAAVAASQAAAQEAARAASQAGASLKRATLAIQAQQAAQAAARDAAGAALRAGPSGIPNGLLPGGLRRATGPNADWIGANAPSETIEGGRTKVNIEQTQKNAILTWQTYNVSENTDLRYDQKGNRDWVALNRVLDPNLAPSKILGTIKSDGTVLVINPNGIIFSGGAQINVGSLIASTLDVGPSVAPWAPAGRRFQQISPGATRTSCKTGCWDTKPRAPMRRTRPASRLFPARRPIPERSVLPRVPPSRPTAMAASCCSRLHM
jgi:filamentous hemagglutinin family protein